MDGITNTAKKIIEAATFADCTHHLEVLAKLARLQNLEFTWTYSDAYETNQRYVSEGEKLLTEIKQFVTQHGTPRAETVVQVA